MNNKREVSTSIPNDQHSSQWINSESKVKPNIPYPLTSELQEIQVYGFKVKCKCWYIIVYFSHLNLVWAIWDDTHKLTTVAYA